MHGSVSGCTKREGRAACAPSRSESIALPARDDVHLLTDGGALLAVNAEQFCPHFVRAGRKAAEFEGRRARRAVALQLDFAASIEIGGFSHDFDRAVVGVG